MFDSSQIAIKCGNYRTETKKTISWLKNNSAFTCRCGTRIQLDLGQFRRELKGIDKSVDDFKRAFKRSIR